MKYLPFLFTLSTFAVSASECQVELFSKVYRLQKDQPLVSRDIVRDSNCSPEITNKLGSIVSNSEGTVGTDFLKSELQKDFSDVTVTFANKKMSLLDFNSAIRDQLLPESNLHFTQARSLNGLSSLGLVEGEQMRAVCDACQSFGEKNIKIDITNVVANSTRTLWFASKIMAKVKVVKAKRNLSFQQKNLEPEDFYFDEVLTMTPDNALTTLDNIRFYKSNKTILQNAVVSNLDLQAVNLVNYGTPVNVSLVSNSIALQKMAMPVRSGRFGETIELKGPNNKNIAGKVVDYNKVVIEL